MGQKTDNERIEDLLETPAALTSETASCAKWKKSNTA